MRRLIRDISSVLIISGVLLVMDAGATLVWQEPVTAVIAMIKRSQIDTRFLGFKSAPLSRLDEHALGSLRSMQARIRYLARREQRLVVTGAAIGRISIAKIGANFDIVQGTDTSSLEKGPGHYPVDLAAGTRPDGGDCGTPHDLPGAVSPYRRPFQRRPDRGEDAVRPLHLRRSGAQDRPTHFGLGDQERRL